MQQRYLKAMHLPKRHIAENLIPALQGLRDAALAMERDYRAKVNCVDPRH